MCLTALPTGTIWGWILVLGVQDGAEGVDVSGMGAAVPSGARTSRVGLVPRSSWLRPCLGEAPGGGCPSPHPSATSHRGMLRAGWQLLASSGTAKCGFLATGGIFLLFDQIWFLTASLPSIAPARVRPGCGTWPWLAAALQGGRSWGDTARGGAASQGVQRAARCTLGEVFAPQVPAWCT